MDESAANTVSTDLKVSTTSSVAPQPQTQSNSRIPRKNSKAGSTAVAGSQAPGGNLSIAINQSRSSITTTPVAHPFSDNPDPSRLVDNSRASTKVPGPIVPVTPTVGITQPSFSDDDAEEAKVLEPVAPKAVLLKELGRTFGPEETAMKSIEARVYERRLMMVEEVVHRLRDPVSGIELKDRSKLFQVYKNSFTGTMLIDWLIPNCNLIGRPDGTRIAQTLMDYSYIISVDMDYKFKEASLFIFQTSFLWPTVPWNNLGRDYFIYLIKRTQRTSKQQQLTVTEEQRLERLMLKFKKTRDEIAQAVKAQSEFTESLSKNEKKIFYLQEHAFWKYQRPLLQTANTPSPTMKDDSTMRVRTFEEYLAQLSDTQLLAYVEKKVSQLQAANYMKRIPISTASKFVIERAVAFQIMDPFVEPLTDNPFICDDPKIWDTVKTLPSPNDIKIWKRNISELLGDPLGLKFFSEYLRKEDAIDILDLYVKIKALDDISSYSEYLSAATLIFNEFIPIGSPREVNITFGIRSRLVATFTILKSQSAEQTAKLELQALNGQLSPEAKLGAADLPVVNLFSGAGVASPSTMNLSNGPTGGSGGNPLISMADVTASFAGLARMECGSRGPAVLAHQYQQIQESKKTGFAISPIDENKKMVSMAGDVATSAALTPERLSTWRLPHDTFSATSQHLLTIMGRDSFAKFWTSPVIKEIMDQIGVKE
ncbi:hypothetical protein BCR33DRAFT_850977 [Rhizoclosmatium globosum]|uniref:RGS domain-containing protein n=1 Tax=Rhizoclosmatium globosum TaxID=329046 RepID=A0A1Y2CBU5_9FUNG|nr:hypothetical protein BCR33DRAFT_850977 [Rhizoclosmatium globosum]|eukprot:ORY43795.1 hypothetical protein BCR33DRAFT_850977 [Rhizoclosmatium globosum]